MIVFELACAHDHRFEGWFASGEEYARQRAGGLVSCPMCGDGEIGRVPSARVSVPKGGRRSGSKARANAAAASTAASASNSASVRHEGDSGNAPSATQGPGSGDATMMAGVPAEVIAKLREIVKHTENVGARFPEEARKIHYEETPPRAIRGQASPEEAQALNDEGIEFSSVPPFLMPDSH